MGLLLGHGAQRVNTGIEEERGGFLPCDTHSFSHPAPSICVLQNSGKTKQNEKQPPNKQKQTHKQKTQTPKKSPTT